jgi:hypothetical protein
VRKRKALTLWVIVLIVVLVLAAGFAVYYFVQKTPSKTATAPNAPSATSSTKSSGKQMVGCQVYQNLNANGATAFKTGDDSLLPADVAAWKGTNTLCGSSADLDYVYYSTTQDDQTLLSYYRQKLTARGCTVEDLETPPDGQVGPFAYVESFTCSDGYHGQVGTDFAYNTYWVQFTK